MRFACLALLFVLPAWTGAQPATDPGCARDLDSLTTAVRRDYAGFPDRAPSREPALAALTDSVRAAAATAATPGECTAALRRWIAFFGDRHLSVSEANPAPAPGAPASPPEPREPTARMLDDSTVVIRLPDFNQRRKPAIDSVIAANRARILSAPYLIVDVRGNGGGWTESYASLLLLVATGPIVVRGTSMRASEGNIAYARQMAAAPGMAPAIRDRIRALIPEMEARRGGFVPVDDDREIRFDTVHPLPRAVAVLVDRRCASSCEQFALDARQSRRVVVAGAESTRGMLDYGNVRTVSLPSGERRLHLPTSRSRRLPAEPLDATGVVPTLRVPPDEADAVAFARRELARRGR
jgi:hypothetical protein